jgi:hypothetical protein
MSSTRVRAPTWRWQLFSWVCVVSSLVLLLSTSAWAALIGSPGATTGQARFEVVPLGSDDQTPKFSHTADGKLNWETNSIGSGGFGGWPTLGAPAIAGDTGVVALPLAGAAAATSTFGGGTMAAAPIPLGPSAGLAWSGTVTDPGPNGFASISTGLASGTWANAGDQTETNPLDVFVVCSQIVVVPAGGLAEIGFAGNTFINSPGGASAFDKSFAVVAGIDNTGSRTNISYGLLGGVPVFGGSFSVVQTAPTTYRVTGAFHFGTAIPDGYSLGLNGNLTLAMDPGAASFMRPGPIPTGAAPVAAGGLGAYGSEAPGFSTEWTNTTGTSDFNIPTNWSNSFPTSTGEAFLADLGAGTPSGTMISAAGPHNLHLITVANSVGNYTVGLTPHQGSFNFGSNGGIEVYAGGPTVMNNDLSSSGQLNFRVADPTTTLKQFGSVASPIVNVDGAGTLQFLSPSVTFNQLQANLGLTEFGAPLATRGSMSIGNGATVQLDATTFLGPPGSVSIAVGGTLVAEAGTTIMATTNSAGTIHLMPGASAMFSGSLTNTGTLTVDAGASGTVSLPYVNSGSITNNGLLTFNGSFTGLQGSGGVGTTVFNGQLSTGTGSASTANLSVGGNAVVNNNLFLRLIGPARGTQYDALSVSGNLNLGGTLHVELDGGYVPALGNSFELLDWGSLSGHFSGVALPPLNPGLAWSTMRLYSTGKIFVADSNFLLGDFNRDGQVTAADIPAMLGALTDLKAYETGANLSDAQLRAIADLNGDGAVDNFDIQVLLDYLADLPGGVGAVTTVPEPTSLILLLVGATAGLLIARVPRRCSPNADNVSCPG